MSEKEQNKENLNISTQEVCLQKASIIVKLEISVKTAEAC